MADVRCSQMLLLQLPIVDVCCLVVIGLTTDVVVVVPTKGALTIFSTFYKKNVRNQTVNTIIE